VTATLCLPICIYHPVMSWGRTQVQSPAEVLALKASALEENATRAGAALGCSYANSGEYEAELISARRAAGAYGPNHGARRIQVAAIAAGLLAVVLLVLLFS
jgi:hypothetical protein